MDEPYIRAVADVERGLNDPPLPPAILHYYDQICERMKEFADSSRRVVLSLLLIAATIELLDRAAVADINLGPVEISDLSLIRKALPALSAYLIYDLIDSGHRYIACRTVATQINQKYRPGLISTWLATLSYPQLSSVFGSFPWHGKGASSFRLIQILGVSLRFSAIILATGLEIFWVWRLLDVYGFADPIVWGTTLVATSFLTYTAVLLWQAYDADHFGRWPRLRMAADAGRHGTAPSGSREPANIGRTTNHPEPDQ